jgi:L-galactose dehydrogenase
MIYNALGRTGLKASIIGLGCGGPSRLGLTYGHSRNAAIGLLRAGLDWGINLVDSAPAYGTEELVGEAIKDRRGEVILATKAALGPYFGPFDGSRIASKLSARLGEDTSFVLSGPALEKRVNASLRRLRTDHVDIFHLHTVTPGQYAPALERLMPMLHRLKESGKIRFVGITEAFPRDTGHRMLARAAGDGAFDCIMIGFNYLNQSGAPIAAEAKRQGTGIIAMCAVRGLRTKESLQTLLNKLMSFGLLDEAEANADRLARLLNDHGVTTLAEGAMRFCRHELPADVVLTGTGDVRHLEANIAACGAGPLPDYISSEFRRLFSKLNSITGGERHSIQRRIT